MLGAALALVLTASGDRWYAAADAPWSRWPGAQLGSHETLTEGDVLVELDPVDPTRLEVPRDHCGPLVTLEPSAYLRVRRESSGVGYVPKTAVRRAPPSREQRARALEGLIARHTRSLAKYVAPYATVEEQAAQPRALAGDAGV